MYILVFLCISPLFFPHQISDKFSFVINDKGDKHMKKKRYISDLMGEEYKKYKNEKVILSAPTGMGKTSFILKNFVPYQTLKGKKTLILCNRKLLRLDYWFSAVQQYDTYSSLADSLEINTYQFLAELMYDSSAFTKFLDGFDVIICDEYHFFYTDSTFNTEGTFLLLPVLMQKILFKLVIFMSATSDDVQPLIQNVLAFCDVKAQNKSYCDLTKRSGKYNSICFRDFSHLLDSERFKCYAVPDEETLFSVLTHSNEKSLVFIDNIAKASEWKSKLQNSKIKKNEIQLLNASSIEEENNSNLISELICANRLSCKILITTSCLDNGISIHDSSVRNLVILCENKTSFIQMSGRLRSESSKQINLYFLLQSSSYYENRMKASQKEHLIFNQLAKKSDSSRPLYQFRNIWNRSNPDSASLSAYRKALIAVPRNFETYNTNSSHVSVLCGNCNFVFNEFAHKKIDDDYFMFCRLYSLAVKDPLFVIYEQMSWIGKSKDELVVLHSCYRAEKENELIEYLNQINCISKDELKKIVKQMLPLIKYLFPDISIANGTLSNEKLIQICKFSGYEFTHSKNQNRIEIYTVKKLSTHVKSSL